MWVELIDQWVSPWVDQVGTCPLYQGTPNINNYKYLSLDQIAAPEEPSSFFEVIILAASIQKLNGEEGCRCHQLTQSPCFPSDASPLLGVLEYRAGSALLKSKSQVLFPSRIEFTVSYFSPLPCFQPSSHLYLQKFLMLPVSEPFQGSVCRRVYYWFLSLQAQVTASFGWRSLYHGSFSSLVTPLDSCCLFSCSFCP